LISIAPYQIYCRPQNPQELFNYRHTLLRNVIERIFGVAKRRFKVLVVAQEYSLDRQSQLVRALGVLHNFILINDPNNLTDDVETQDNFTNVLSAHQEERAVTNAERARAAERQDKIANDMWHDYERGVRQHVVIDSTEITFKFK
jgi:hypothetical protein